MSKFTFDTGESAIEYRKSLEQQKSSGETKSDTPSTEGSTDETNEILKSSLHLFQKIPDKPLSVSFLNIQFTNRGEKGALDVNFLKQNQDKFSLFVIGSDLKVCLREEFRHELPTESKYGRELIQIFEKDITKLNILKGFTEDTFENFVKKYSTNKYKIGYSFLVRNSHALEIFSKDGETYVRNRDQSSGVISMSEKDVWETLINKGIEYFLVSCLEGFLKNFFTPINQGILQSCFNFQIVVDKHFLLSHDDLFVGRGADGVLLKVNSKPTPTKGTCSEVDASGNLEQHKDAPTTEKPEKSSTGSYSESDLDHEKTISTKDSCSEVDASESLHQCKDPLIEDNETGPIYQPYKINSNSDMLFQQVQKAISENRTVVLFGKNNPFVTDIATISKEERLKVLGEIQRMVDNEQTP